MVKEAVVEAVVAALGRGETVLSVARAYDLDPKTVRSWPRRGQYGARRPASGRRGGLLAPFLTWLTVRAPEVGFNAVVLHRELRERGSTGSAIIVRRAVRPWRLAATPVATVRFESAPGEQAQVDFGQQRVWSGTAGRSRASHVSLLCGFAAGDTGHRSHEWYARLHDDQSAWTFTQERFSFGAHGRTLADVPAHGYTAERECVSGQRGRFRCVEAGL